MANDDEHPSTESSEAFLRLVAHAPAVTDLVGKTVGRYEIVRRLGEGGMGVVYQAEDSVLRRSVALKVLDERFRDDEERRRRFLREARLAGALVHPNIATVFDAGVDGDRFYLAMELVSGSTLRMRIAEGRVTNAEALRFARAIAIGLAKAHGAGIVHRDLKPENVMVDTDDTVKILDFGLAKVPRRVERSDTTTTQDGRILGTPTYMSPEQAKGKPVDERSDVFSFGVLLYELVTGQRPFDRATTLEVLIAIDRDEPIPPREIAPEISDGLERIILRCLRKDPAERFASGTELAGALSAADVIVARRDGPPSPRRARALGVGLAFGLAAVAAVATIGGRLTAPPSAREAPPRAPHMATVSAPAAASALDSESAAPAPAPSSGGPFATSMAEAARGRPAATPAPAAVPAPTKREASPAPAPPPPVRAAASSAPSPSSSSPSGPGFVFDAPF